MKLYELIIDIQNKQIAQEEKIDLLGQIVVQQQLEIAEIKQKLDTVLEGSAG